MWKAMLFDCSLILISQCNNLQFYVAEALKQLIFPLAWQHSYIQPAGESLRDYAESPSPVIFCCNPLCAGYDHFRELQQNGFNNLAILDIDGSFTNDLHFPKLQMEENHLRSLNFAKNTKVAKYDYAYREMLLDDELQDEDKRFVNEVRQKFFGILRPLLVNVKDCIKDEYRIENRHLYPGIDFEVCTVFDKYFDKPRYMEDHIGEGDEGFIKRFIDSS